MVWFGLVWFGLVWFGWVGLGWVGLGWVGLGWVGLGWVGLGWVGLVGCLVVGVDVSLKSLTQRKERPRKAFLLERDPIGNRNQLSDSLHCTGKQFMIFSSVFMIYMCLLCLIPEKSLQMTPVAGHESGICIHVIQQFRAPMITWNTLMILMVCKGPL